MIASQRTASTLDSTQPASDTPDPLHCGCLCLLDGERRVRVYLDLLVGQPWSGRYRVPAADGSWIRGVERIRLTLCAPALAMSQRQLIPVVTL